MRMEDSVRILHKHSRRFCYFQEKCYICIELFDEMQSAAVQRSYTVAKSLPTTFLISTPHCHSDRYTKVSYPTAKIIKYSYMLSFTVLFSPFIFCAKRFFVLSQTIFQSAATDFRLWGTRFSPHISEPFLPLLNYNLPQTILDWILS